MHDLQRPADSSMGGGKAASACYREAAWHRAAGPNAVQVLP